MMPYFNAYATALKSSWYNSVVKWVVKTGTKRVLFSVLLLISSLGIKLYEYLFLGPPIPEDPNWTTWDTILVFSDFAALGIIALNGLAWAVSEFKYNVIFLTQLVLVVVYLAVYYADLLFNAALIPYALVLTSAIILILPSEAKQRFRRRSRRRSSSRSSSSSRSRSKKTTTPAASPEASITES
ncbi:MAG: hypothetical protein RIS91_429 [Bacteroidota bacterium]|jgi:hypothetical protein